MADILELKQTTTTRKKKPSETQRLKAELDKAHKKVDEALVLLRKHIELLSEKQRYALPRPHGAFVYSARRLIEAVQAHPDLALAARFDGREVLSLLDKVEVAASLQSKTATLAKLLADARLAWLAQAFTASRAPYGMAKAGAQTDDRLRTVVDALAPAFSRRRPLHKKDFVN